MEICHRSTFTTSCWETFVAETVQNRNKEKQIKLKMSLHRGVCQQVWLSMTKNPSEMICRKSCCWCGSAAGRKNTEWIFSWRDQSLLIPAWSAWAVPSADLLAERHHRSGFPSLPLHPQHQLSACSGRSLNHSLPLCQASSLFEVNVSKLSVVSLLIRKRLEWLHF